MSNIEKPDYRKIRKEVLLTEPAEGFLYESRNQAIAAISDRINKVGTGWLFDVDDTLLVATQFLLAVVQGKLRMNGTSISAQQFINEGGNFERSKHLIAAAKAQGIDLNALIADLFVNPNVYALMPPILSAQRIHQLLQVDHVAGYITARPAEVAKVTAASLTRHGFVSAPLIHTNPPVDLNYQKISKVEVLKQILSQVTNLAAPLIFLDDHPHTIEEIQSEINPKYCRPILVQGIRSRAGEQTALTHRQIEELINKQHEKQN